MLYNIDKISQLVDLCRDLSKNMPQITWTHVDVNGSDIIFMGKYKNNRLYIHYVVYNNSWILSNLELYPELTESWKNFKTSKGCYV